MQITDIRIRKTYDEGKIKAIVSITIDEQFVIHDIKILEGDNGLFIAMPSRKISNGTYKDVAHPINIQTRTEMQGRILSAYTEKISSINNKEADIK